MPVSFNLVDKPWLPVVWLDGTAGEVGLRDALVRAHEIRELVDGSPLVTVSLHRLLLAILHRNFGPTSFEAWKALWRQGRWDAEKLDSYFTQWRHRFAPGGTHNTEHVFGLALAQPLPVTLAPDEHTAFAWLSWPEAVQKCFSWSNRDAIRMLGENGP